VGQLVAGILVVEQLVAGILVVEQLVAGILVVEQLLAGMLVQVAVELLGTHSEGLPEHPCLAGVLSVAGQKYCSLVEMLRDWLELSHQIERQMLGNCLCSGD